MDAIGDQQLKQATVCGAASVVFPRNYRHPKHDQCAAYFDCM